MKLKKDEGLILSPRSTVPSETEILGHEIFDYRPWEPSLSSGLAGDTQGREEIGIIN